MEPSDISWQGEFPVEVPRSNGQSKLTGRPVLPDYGGFTSETMFHQLLTTKAPSCIKSAGRTATHGIRLLNHVLLPFAECASKSHSHLLCKKCRCCVVHMFCFTCFGYCKSRLNKRAIFGKVVKITFSFSLFLCTQPSGFVNYNSY